MRRPLPRGYSNFRFCSPLFFFCGKYHISASLIIISIHRCAESCYNNHWHFKNSPQGNSNTHKTHSKSSPSSSCLLALVVCGPLTLSLWFLFLPLFLSLSLLPFFYFILPPYFISQSTTTTIGTRMGDRRRQSRDVIWGQQPAPNTKHHNRLFSSSLFSPHLERHAPHE